MSINSISYDKLWSLMKELHLPKSWLCNKEHKYHITTRTLAKLSKNQSVNTDTLMKVCLALDVNISDICEFVSTDNSDININEE